MSGVGLGTHESNDMFCEVGVEFAALRLDTVGAVSPVGGHDDDVGSCSAEWGGFQYEMWCWFD